MSHTGILRTRWAAIGAAVAVTLGAGTLATVDAVTSSGERSILTPIVPCRLMDTRLDSRIGPHAALGPSETVTVLAEGAQGNCAANDLPADATALQLNVTAIGATAPTFLAITPDGSTDSSALNPVPGAPPTPNAVTVSVIDGEFRIFNRFGQVDVIVDVTGVYTDHDHDDRYYTETEADERFARAQPDSVILHIGHGFGENGYTYREAVWDRPAAGGQACVRFPAEVPAGRTIDRIEVRYISETGIEAEALYFSVTNSNAPLPTEPDLFDVSLSARNTLPASTSADTQIATFTFVDDSDRLPEFPRTTTVDNGTAAFQFCSDEGPLAIVGVEVFLATD